MDLLAKELEALRARTARLYAVVAEFGCVTPEVQLRLADALDGLADAVQQYQEAPRPKVGRTFKLTWAVE